MSAENDNKPLEEVKAPEVQSEGTQEVCVAAPGGRFGTSVSGKRGIRLTRLVLGTADFCCPC